jgi:phosphoribosylaminoimidazolecarboxamide formyltransferase/IMP cyclohydrolase
MSHPSSSVSILPSLSASSSDFVPLTRAIISVYDKNGLLPLAQALSKAGVQLISTGGTSQLLASNQIPHSSIESLTNYPEILSGRVKTLHPAVHGGILSVRGLETHEQEMKTHEIKPIDLVVCNLYPFASAAAASLSSPDPFSLAIENIDIGGPTLIRASAKNHQFVCSLTQANQYQEFINEIQQNEKQFGKAGTTLKYRRQLAGAAFHHTALYEKSIDEFFQQQLNKQQTTSS